MIRRPDIVIRRADTGADLAEAKSVFLEYLEYLGLDLGFQGTEEEFRNFPGPYGPPSGLILLAELDGETLGAIALKKLEPGTCEMKRLFVRPQGRGCSLGRRLSARLMDEAKEMGYTTMKLDTLARLTHAKALYEAMGFCPTAPYNDNPFPDILYYSRAL